MGYRLVNENGVDCSPGKVLLEQLKRIRTFVYILVALFGTLVITTAVSQWQGVSIIVNVYLYVFSFYLIYIFSTLDIGDLKRLYRDRYGRRGETILFLVVRVIPFLIIYFITALFVIINYYDESFWPWRPLMELLDGRFSNIVFYSLILMVIVKLRNEPRITIPLFLLFSVLYYLVYKLVYTFSPTGLSISMLKTFQISAALFFALYEFIFMKEKILKIAVMSLALGCACYFLIVGALFAISNFSGINSYRQVRSSMILLKLGFSSPLDRLEEAARKADDPRVLADLIYYSDKYDRNISFTMQEWEGIFSAGNSALNDRVSQYLMKKGIDLPCSRIVDFAEKESAREGKALLAADNLTAYAAKCCGKDLSTASRLLNDKNVFYRSWFIGVAAKTGSPETIPFLLDMLTGGDEKLAGESYRALVAITGIDKEGRYRDRYNDIGLVTRFGAYYRDTGFKN